MKNLIFIFLFFLLLTACTSNDVQTQQSLDLMAEGFVSPVSLVSPDDGTGRLFVVDRVGEIRILTKDNVLLEDPFLDLKSKLVNLRSTFDERGLLSLAFHPDFESNGRFFVYYSAPLREEAPEGWDHTSTISEFIVSSNPDKADIASEKKILEIDEPQFNHDGGQLLFGSDGYLYISVGDGGKANDVGLGHPDIGNGQDTLTLLGSILRIDIDNGQPYSVPEDNPFVGEDGRDEIYAYGFRNPFRMSFDRETGRLFVADVGQNLWEEVDIVEKGMNYGWHVKEGSHCFDPENPDKSLAECPDKGLKDERLIDPILEYQNANAEEGIGLSVIGGFVYRGKAIPDLYGKYIFGDWSESFLTGKGKIFVAEESNGSWSIIDSAELSSFILGFGQDADNELYVLASDSTGPTGNSGKVYKLKGGF